MVVSCWRAASSRLWTRIGCTGRCRRSARVSRLGRASRSRAAAGRLSKNGMSMSETPSPVGTDPPVTLVGEKVALGPAHKGLLPLLWKWENDLELGALTGDPARPMTPEAIDKLYERHSSAGPDATSFVIYERATMRPIG